MTLAIPCLRPAESVSTRGHPRRNRRARRQSVAFTLIELLVVVAIVGVLASLILPSLSRASQRARDTKCLGHLRQLGIASQLYWDDHDGETFRYRGAPTNHGVVYWFGWLGSGAEGDRVFDPTIGALWPYLATRDIGVCPALRTSALDFKPKAAGGAFGYGYNLALSPPDGQPPIRPQSTPCPAELAVLADAAQVNDFQPPASPDHPLLEEFYYLSSREPTVHFRHQERAQVLFADSHAARESAVTGSLDPRLPEAGVGRLRTEILVIP